MNATQMAESRLELGRRLPSGAASAYAASAIVNELAAGLLLRCGYRGRIHGMTAQASELAFQQAEREHGEGGCDLRATAKDLLSYVGQPDPQGTAQRIEAAFSSATGAAALAATFGTLFTQALGASADSTAGWVAEKPLANLRQQTRPRVAMPGKLNVLPPGQTAGHASLGIEGGEQFQPYRFAKQIVLDEQLLVQDDVASIADAATLLGRAAGSLRSDLVYSVLLANPALSDSVALFHSTHENLATGAALAYAKLDEAVAAMAKQRENLHPVGAKATYVLVPPELENAARRLVRDLTTGTTPPLTVRAEPRLSLGVVNPSTGETHSGSSTSWYVAASATDAPSIELSLRTPQPELRQFTLGQGRWGIGWDCVWDIGCAALSYYGIRRSDA